MIYRTIVGRKVGAAWQAINERRAEAVLADLAQNFEHSFAGDHSFGGTRRTKEAQAEWFARMFAVLPDIHFVVRDVWVKGPPWRTRVVAVVDVTLRDDPAYTNTVVQLIDLSMGKITRIENHEDTQAFVRLLERRKA